MPISPHTFSFWIRWVHTVSMGFLVGGTLLMWVDTLRPRAEGEHAWYGPLAERFELFFWLAMGVQVITGIGNLGAFGASLPQPTSAWGARRVVILLISLKVTVLAPILSNTSPTINAPTAGPRASTAVTKAPADFFMPRALANTGLIAWAEMPK